MKRLIIFSLSAVLSVGQASESELQACRKKLIFAQKIDLLYDLDWNGKKMPKVVAGKTFFTIPIDAKEGFAETVNCFLMAGENDKFIDFEILDWRTGKAVGKFSYGRYKNY